MSEFLDSLVSLLQKGGEKDGAATARANLQQAWDYPSLTAALPWRYYDDTNDLFINNSNRDYQPLVYGFMTQDDLARRFLNVSTGFKPNF